MMTVRNQESHATATLATLVCEDPADVEVRARVKEFIAERCHIDDNPNGMKSVSAKMVVQWEEYGDSVDGILEALVNSIITGEKAPVASILKAKSGKWAYANITVVDMR